MGDALQLLLVDQFGDALQQRLLVDLIGQLIDDDGLSVALFHVLEVRARPHHDAAAASQVALAYAGSTVDNARCRKVGCRDDPDQVIDRQLGVFQQRQTAVHHFVQIVGRNVRRHADFRIAHGGSVVAVDRAEVALSIDQHVAQAEILRHADDGVVDRGIAVRMVLADHVADNAG